MSDTVIVKKKDLYDFCLTLLTEVGVPKADAEYTAECLVRTNLWAVDSHGVIRLPVYVKRLRGGGIKPVPNIRVEREFGGLARMDGDAGLGFVVGRAAMEKALSLAKTHGIGAVAVRNSNHFGAAALYTRWAAETGMIGIAMSDTLPLMAGPGSRAAAAGNNPMSFAFPPFDQGRPFVFDIALSQVAGGKLLMAKEKGQKIPLDWAVDKEGNPTDDPAAGFAGFLLPVGGHKGFGLALVVEMLTALLSCGGVMWELHSMYKSMDTPSNTNHFMLVVNPTAIMDQKDWTERYRKLKETIKAVPMRDAGAELVFPGEIEDQNATAREKEGIPLPRSLYDELLGLAKEFAPQAKL